MSILAVHSSSSINHDELLNKHVFPASTLQQGYSSMFIKEICIHLLKGLQYRREDDIKESNTTYQMLRSELLSYDDGGAWFDAMCRQATNLAELPYPGHSSEIRLYIARFSWFFINIDDLSQKYPSALEGFQQCIFLNEDPEGNFLQDFRQHLVNFYRFWDPIPANSISIAAMDFINGCLLEQMPTICDMKLSDDATSWPFYLRKMTGCAAAYAFMIFPKDLKIDISVYIQAIEDIVLFIDLLNDVLSFYKEELAGEKNNYVYNRARVTHRSIPETLHDIVDDVLAAHKRVTKILEFTDASIPWKRFVNGFITFHVALKRYRLSEIGL